MERRGNIVTRVENGLVDLTGLMWFGPLGNFPYLRDAVYPDTGPAIDIHPIDPARSDKIMVHLARYYSHRDRMRYPRPTMDFQIGDYSISILTIQNEDTPRIERGVVDIGDIAHHILDEGLDEVRIMWMGFFYRIFEESMSRTLIAEAFQRCCENRYTIPMR